MLPRGKHIHETLIERQQLVDKEKEAKDICETLAKSHKQAYIDWVGLGKKEETYQTHAEKAIVMLLNKMKTV